MVAACRALECDDPIGLVRDPFAARLAGERGLAIFRALPHAEFMRFGIAIRSHFIDELLLAALAAEPIATVVSVGCGLDSRPWRLELPPDLRWIEVDFADMLDYKDALLAAEKPRCRRERLAADVNDAAQRRAIYETVGRAPALMITEGLLMYLPSATVDAIAAEAWQESGIARWMSDIATTAFQKAIGVDMPQSVRDMQPSDHLTGEQVLDRVRQRGWTTGSHRSYITDTAFAAKRIQALMGERAPAPPPSITSDPTGIHLFTRG
jgi:methyltransferase (TIGR00027 family)